MKSLLKIEEIFLFGLAIFLFSRLGYSWVWYLFLGHSSLDRIFGYGLKYPDRFQNTHLGLIGKQSDS